MHSEPKHAYDELYKLLLVQVFSICCIMVLLYYHYVTAKATCHIMLKKVID